MKKLRLLLIALLICLPLACAATAALPAPCTAAALFCMHVLIAPAMAAEQTFGSFHALVPAGWESREEAYAAIFTSPDKRQSIFVLVIQYDKPSPAELMKDRAGKNSVRRLGGTLGYIYERDGFRSWAMLTEHGTFCEISLDAPYQDLEAFLAGLRADEDMPGLQEAFLAVQNKQAVDWLNYVTERFGPQVQKHTGEALPASPFSGGGIVAKLPQGWQAQQTASSVIFTSPDRKEKLTARMYPLNSDDMEGFMRFAEGYAASIGGHNLRYVEGNFEFTTGNGRALMTQHGETCLFLLLRGDSPDLDNLLLSISPE